MLFISSLVANYVENSGKWKACSPTRLQNNFLSCKPIDTGDPLDFQLPLLNEALIGASNNYRWRNDIQIDEICSNPRRQSEFVKIYNDMPPIKLRKKSVDKKLTIFLDLDETFFNRPIDEKGEKIEFFNPIRENETQYVKMRPFTIEFLTYLSKHADLYAWTMSNRSRGETMLTVFDVKHYFKDLITHEQITSSVRLPKIHIKAIEKTFDAARDASNTLHLDDRSGAFVLNQLNGLRIGRYESNDRDIQLLGIKEVFGWIFHCYDLTQDVQDCVAALKTENPGLFDGYQHDEMSFVSEKQLQGYRRYTDENLDEY
eukprot:NODE_548_length_6849_cov_0.379852.p1 type:complete len:315 gc:universal NODE_548_length_6849_cov_0.379852:3281-2337(-)